ncbi:MAG: RHS repeat-associated core domain-containing protein, partial [Planctomycetota bacterium]
ARYYDSATGQWISQDPIGFAAGDGNLYRYVGNGVSGSTDPSGLDERNALQRLFGAKTSGNNRRKNVLARKDFKAPEIPSHFSRTYDFKYIPEASFERSIYSYDVYKKGEDYHIRRSRRPQSAFYTFSFDWDSGSKENFYSHKTIVIRGNHKVPSQAYLQLSRQTAVENAFSTLHESVTYGEDAAVVGMFIGSLFVPGPEDVLLAALAARHGIRATTGFVRGNIVQKFVRESGEEVTEKEVKVLMKEISDSLGYGAPKGPSGPFGPNSLGSAGALPRNISRISESPKLVRAAEEAGKSVQKSIDKLTHELSRGNLNPGIGTKPIGKGISEARARDGARVYFRQLADGTTEILGKSNKANQSAVIAEILRLFGG